LPSPSLAVSAPSPTDGKTATTQTIPAKDHSL
jgi:hypothetical protein